MRPATRVWLWWAATAIVAAALLLLSLSDTVYELTSPPGPLQILLRKTYSVGAFALVGYLYARSWQASGRVRGWLYLALSIAGYSALIEIVQAIDQSHEGLAWNAVDVACGFIGGALAGWIYFLTSSRPPP